jgi:hypothetical protein
MWRSQELSFIASGNVNGTDTMEGSLVLCCKIMHTCSGITFFGIYKAPTFVHTETCMWMFISPLFTIAQIWK